MKERTDEEGFDLTRIDRIKQNVSAQHQSLSSAADAIDVSFVDKIAFANGIVSA